MQQSNSGMVIVLILLVVGIMYILYLRGKVQKMKKNEKKNKEKQKAEQKSTEESK